MRYSMRPRWKYLAWIKTVGKFEHRKALTPLGVLSEVLV